MKTRLEAFAFKFNNLYRYIEEAQRRAVARDPDAAVDGRGAYDVLTLVHVCTPHLTRLLWTWPPGPRRRRQVLITCLQPPTCLKPHLSCFKASLLRYP